MIAVCDWSDPGHNRYTGDQIEAVQRLPLSAEAAHTIIAKMKVKSYDDILEISKDKIAGVRGEYAPEITYMNFGTGSVCRKVTRNTWKPADKEYAMAYCFKGTCVIVPSVCGNVAAAIRTKIVPGEPLRPPALIPTFNPDKPPAMVQDELPKKSKAVNSVPEPSSVWLIGIALAVAGFFTRKKTGAPVII